LHSAGAVIDVRQIDLVTTASVAGITADTFEGLAADAKSNCPISKALAAVPISLHATFTTA
jgi:osmotically inducible protein OsmC